MANICATEDGYQRKTQMHGFMVLICGAYVYMCILIMVLFHNSSTEQPLKEFQIVDFKPDISPTVYSAGFLLEPNSSKESGDKSTTTNISSKENGLSNERIVISSSNYKHQDNRTSMTWWKHVILARWPGSGYVANRYTYSPLGWCRV